MKLWRAVLLTIVVAACTTILQAGPHVIIHDPNGTGTPVGLMFTFNADAFGGGTFMFTNTSGVNWHNLYVSTPAPSPIDAIGCGGDSFAFCTIILGPFPFYATVAFAGPPGITTGELFYIDLGTSGWTPFGQFLAVANYGDSVPEPTSLWLLAGGIGALLTRKRLL